MDSKRGNSRISGSFSFLSLSARDTPLNNRDVEQMQEHIARSLVEIEKNSERERLEREPKAAKETRAVLNKMTDVISLIDHTFVAGEWLPAHHTIDGCSGLVMLEIGDAEEPLTSFESFDFEKTPQNEGERSFSQKTDWWRAEFSRIDVLLPEIFRFYLKLDEELHIQTPTSLQSVYKIYKMYQFLYAFAESTFTREFEDKVRSQDGLSKDEQMSLEMLASALEKFLFMLLLAVKIVDQFKIIIADAKKHQEDLCIDFGKKAINVTPEPVKIEDNLTEELNESKKQIDKINKEINDTAIAIAGYEAQLKGCAEESRESIQADLDDEKQYLKQKIAEHEQNEKRHAKAKKAVEDATATATKARQAKWNEEAIRAAESVAEIQKLNTKLGPFFANYASAIVEELTKLSLEIQADLPGINPSLLESWLEKNKWVMSTKNQDRQYLSSLLSLKVFNLTMTLAIEDGIVKVRLKNNNRNMLQDLFIALNEPSPEYMEFGKKSVAQEIADDLLASIKSTNTISSLVKALPDELPYVIGLLKKISAAEENEEAFAVFGLLQLLYFQYGPKNQKELTASRFRWINEFTKIVKEKYGYDLSAGRFSYERSLSKYTAVNRIKEESEHGAGAYISAYEDVSADLTNKFSGLKRRVSLVFDVGVKANLQKLPLLFSRKNENEEADISDYIKSIFSTNREHDSPKKDNYPYNDRALSPTECEVLVTTLTSDYINEIKSLLTGRLDEITLAQRNRIKKTVDLLKLLPLEYRLPLITNKDIKLLVILSQLLAYEQDLLPKKLLGTSVIKAITDMVKKDLNNIPALEFVLLYEIFVRFKTAMDFIDFKETLLVKVYSDVNPDNDDHAMFPYSAPCFIQKKIIENPSTAIVNILDWFTTEELEKIFEGIPDILAKLPGFALPAEDDSLSSSLQIELVDQLFIVLAVQEAALKFYKPIQDTHNSEMLVIASRDSWFLQFRFLSAILDKKLKAFTLSLANQVIKNSIYRLSSNMIWHITKLSEWMAACFVNSYSERVNIIEYTDHDSLFKSVIFGFAQFFSILFLALHNKQGKRSNDASFFLTMHKHFNDIIMMMNVDLSDNDPAIIFSMMVYFFDKNELLENTGISVVNSEDLSGDAGRGIIEHWTKRKDLNAVYSYSEGRISLGRHPIMGRISSDDGANSLIKSMFFSDNAEHILFQAAFVKIA